MRLQNRLSGTVTSLIRDTYSLQEAEVQTDQGLRLAIAYPALTGRLVVGDEVLLNTCAVEMKLGTGGVDFVCDIRPCRAESSAPGHIIKLRYTPLQHPVLCAEAPESPYHEALRDFRSLEETPVVCAELHSQIGAVAAAVKWETQGRARVVYVMTDGAALPISFSRIVDELKREGLVDATVTCGQAHGGDFEAINLYSGLAVARTAGQADVIVVSQGPGSAGTGTPLGFSGIDQGIALNAASALDGTAIAVVRMSFADSRERHRGLSYHTRTVLERVVLCPVLIPIPRVPEEDEHFQQAAAEYADMPMQHEFVAMDADTALEALQSVGVRYETMGRSMDEDRTFFLAAASAGLLAGQWFNGCLDEISDSPDTVGD